MLHHGNELDPNAESHPSESQRRHSDPIVGPPPMRFFAVRWRVEEPHRSRDCCIRRLGKCVTGLTTSHGQQTRTLHVLFTPSRSVRSFTSAILAPCPHAGTNSLDGGRSIMKLSLLPILPEELARIP